MAHPFGQKATSAGPTALTYITIGALLSVWSGIWFVYERNRGDANGGVNYICAGLLLTGIALLIIGFFVGRLAHKAHAVEIQQDAAKAMAIQQDPAVAHKV